MKNEDTGKSSLLLIPNLTQNRDFEVQIAILAPISECAASVAPAFLPSSGKKRFDAFLY
jgi:hypothetical protein